MRSVYPTCAMVSDDFRQLISKLFYTFNKNKAPRRTFPTRGVEHFAFLPSVNHFNSPAA